jgi:hypothetical protein
MRHNLILAVAVMVSACTAVHYESPQLAERQPSRDTIAVLPFEMVFTGKIPKDASPEHIMAIEEAESLAFQHALYNRLLDRSSVTRKRPILVNIQPFEVTNRILSDKELEIRDTWRLAPEHLADALGVDAVIRTRVVKDRYLSDLASYGTEVGLHVLYEATEGHAAWLIPPGLTRTHDIHVYSALVSCPEGDLLWKVEVHRATDWRRPANDVIVGLTKKLSKKFPYRG